MRWAAIVMLFIAYCGVISAEDNLPAWFYLPPQQPGILCEVGYADPYYVPSSSYNEAFEDAAMRLWANRHCIIQVEAAAATHHDDTRLLGGRYAVEFDTIGYSEFKSQLVRIDSCWTDRIVVMLVANDLISVNSSLIESPDSLFLNQYSTDWVYGQGTAPEYYHMKSTWLEAEKYARRNLAFCANSLMDIWVITNELYYNRYSTRRARIEIRNMNVIRRYVDKSGKGFVVVLRAPRVNIVNMLEISK